MLCNKCNKNEATYFVERNINGNVTKVALCPECAKEYGDLSFSSFNAFNLLGGLFGSPMVKKSEPAEKKRCTLCASSFDEIVKSGRVGCAECYDVFKNELEGTIKRIHGNVKHVGRTPANVGKAERQEDEMTTLRKQLEDAVAREDYESAAELRDRIRALGE